MGTRYYGDNLDILRRYLKDELLDPFHFGSALNFSQTDDAFFQKQHHTANRPQAARR